MTSSFLNRWTEKLLFKETPFWSHHATSGYMDDAAAPSTTSRKRPSVPAHLDLCYITDNLLAASAPLPPLLAPATYGDTGRDEPATRRKQQPTTDRCNNKSNDDDESICVEQLQEDQEPSQQQSSQAPRRSGNSAAALATFLDQHYSNNKYMVFGFGPPPDDRTLLLFRRQIVQLDDGNAKINSHTRVGSSDSRSTTIQKYHYLLDACYAIHAWLSADPSHVAVIWCPNGKTHTAMALAVYLKFTEQVDSMQDGFCHVVQRILRLPMQHDCDDDDDEKKHYDLSPTIQDVLQQLPPSIHQLFHNMDSLLELGECIQSRPLLLRAIALQGVPVETTPVLQLFDATCELECDHSRGRSNHRRRRRRPVYSSTDNSNSVVQWVEDEGFFRVDQVVQGDFRLECRFGSTQEDDGDDESDNDDVSKLIFSLVHSTGFLAAGTHELTTNQVDLMPRYKPYFDDDDFLLTLVFESYWNTSEDKNADDANQLLQQDCSERILPRVLYDMEAVQQGWWIIHLRHSARPADEDVDRFLADLKTMAEDAPAWALETCPPRHLIALALQLYNFHWARTREALTMGDFCKWWGLGQDGEGIESDNANTDELDASTLTEADGRDPRASWHDRNEYTAICYESPVMFPRPGDIVHSLGTANIKDIVMNKETPFDNNARPLFPYIAKNNQAPLLVPSKMDDPRNQAAVDVFLRLNHPEVSLQDLLDVQRASKHWNSNELSPNSAVSGEAPGSSSAGNHSEVKGIANDMSSGLGTPFSDLDASSTDHGSARGESDLRRRADEKMAPPASESSAVLNDEIGQVTGATKGLLPKHEGPPLKDDPKFEKYFRMLKAGLPMPAVRHALQRDGLEPSILDLDQTNSHASQSSCEAISFNKTSGDTSIKDEQATDGIDAPLKEDTKYAKYFRMLDVGLAEGAVRNALQRDGHDPSIIDLDPTKSYASQQMTKDPIKAASQAQTSDLNQLGCAKVAQSAPPLKDDPAFAKYFSMLDKGIPRGAVQNALRRDGQDLSILDLDPLKSYASQAKHDVAIEAKPLPLKDDPEWKKYYKMLAMGMPMGAVQNAVTRDGKDPSIMELDPNKPLASAQSTPVKDTGVALKHDPDWKKYYSMLAMGIPLGAVKNAVVRDGKDPGVLDLDAEKSLNCQKPDRNTVSHRKKKPVRRKKIFWKPVDPRQVKDNSLWSLVKGMDSLRMSSLKYDEKEFADLFTQSTEAHEQDKQRAPSTPSKTKKTVKVVDGKRSMNGGIVLLRLKMECDQIARLVDEMEHGGLDSTQLNALKEFLPTVDEKEALKAYMKEAGPSEAERKAAIADLSECEKYMLTMLEVSDASAKIDCILFRVQFKQRLSDSVNAIRVVDNACNEVVSSSRLRNLMAMILTLVNQINTGGDGEEIGFSLDALLKLNEAKAFDRKTTVLQYLFKLVKDNDPELCRFSDDLNHTHAACEVVFENVVSDIQQLAVELALVKTTVMEQADQMEAKGDTQKVTLSELREQRSTLHSVEQVPQYNQANIIGGRTSMERFVTYAESSVNDSIHFASTVQANYRKLLEFVCEEESMRANEFFGTMRRFILAFAKAGEVAENEEKVRVREQKRMSSKSNGAVGGPDKGVLAAIATSAMKKRTELSMGPGSPSLKDVARTESTDARQTQSELVRRNDSHAPVPAAFAAIAAAAASKRQAANANTLVDQDGSLASHINGSGAGNDGGQVIDCSRQPAAVHIHETDSASGDNAKSWQREGLRLQRVRGAISSDGARHVVNDSCEGRIEQPSREVVDAVDTPHGSISLETSFPAGEVSPPSIHETKPDANQGEDTETALSNMPSMSGNVATSEILQEGSAWQEASSSSDEFHEAASGEDHD